LNLVHVEDGARAVLAAEQRGRVGETYLIADSAPMRRRDFYSFMAELLGAPAPTFQVDPLSAMENNRRIMNRKMLQELGVELTYPNYREGLRASI
jgi:nucleoside-diphosphate-sugar epimerase